MSAVRILLSAARAPVTNDHLWRPEDPASGAAPALLDCLPTVDRYKVIVPPERVRLFCLSIPAGPHKKALAALPFLVEEQLAESLEHYECVVLPQLNASAGKIWLAVLERDWLSAVRTALAGITQGDIDWVVEGWQWPRCETWALRLDGARVLLCRGGPDMAALPVAWLIPALGAAHGAQRIETLTVAGTETAEHELEKLAAWCASQGITLERVAADALPDAWSGSFDATPWRLFEQRRSSARRAWQRLRQPASWALAGKLVVAALFLELVGALAWWGVLAHRIDSDRAAAVAVFREMAGPSAVVVDPLLQARRLLQTQRHAAGLSVDRDFLPLLAALGEQLPPGMASPLEIQYDSQRLRLTYPKAAAPALQGLLTRLRQSGWVVDINAAADSNQSILQVSKP